MTPSMDALVEQITPGRTFSEKVRNLLKGYENGKMTKVELLEELEGLVGSEWTGIQLGKGA